MMLRLPHIASSLRSVADWQGAVLLIVATLAIAWVQGSYSQFVPCVQDCGETFVAQQSVVNYRLYGAKYWLLQDHATIPDIDRHPFIYTHNIHVGTLFFPLLDQIGISALWGKQLVTLLALGAGLFYVFLTVRFVTKSKLIGLCVLALFCMDYAQVFSFALNALRAWHWLALFGLIYHALQLVSATEFRRTAHLAAMTAFSALSFSIGYEFLAIALAITFFVTILCTRSLGRTALCLGWLAGSVVLIFAARQAQVIAVLGVKFWSLDVFYSAVIKLTLLAAYFQIPSLAEIDEFYKAHSVLRPFAAVAPVDQIVLGIKQHLQKITIPSVGFGATVSCCLAAVLSAIVVTAWALRPLIAPFIAILERRSLVRWKSGSRVFDGLQYRAGDWIDANLSARFFVALLLGTAAGLFAFGSVAISIYLKHQMPLVAAVLLLPEGVFVALCLRFAVARSRNAGLRLTATALAFLLIADHAAIQFQNVTAIRPMPVAWIPEVAKRQDATFAVSWIPSSVAGFTRNWVIGIQPGLERRVLERANRGEQPFTEGDLLEVNTLYKDDVLKYRLLQPDYWLYFATDQKAEIQNTVPACNRSYSRRVFDDLIFPTGTPQLKRIGFVDRPGMRLFSGELNVTGRAVEAIELSVQGRVLARVGLDCDSSMFAGALPSIAVPVADDRDPVTIVALKYSGERYALGSVDMSWNEPPANLPASLPHRQPSAETLIELNRSLPIAAKGPGFVLFDLRQFWKH